MTARGLFVVGTDTGVGKTVVAASLIYYLRSKGTSAGGFKPVETGGIGDSAILREAAGGEDPPELVNPYNFELPVSPHQAAEEEARAIEIPVIVEAFKKLCEKHDFIIVEGAGGLLVPLAKDYLIADLIKELELPVLVVARAAVGTINHTLLTIRQAQSLGLEVMGVIINHNQPLASSERVSRPEDFAHYTEVPLLGKFPHLGSFGAESLSGVLEENIDLSFLPVS